MRKWIAQLLALVMVLTGSAAMAETRITVTGTGETQISADTAVISLGVSTRDKDVLRAQQKVNETIDAVRKALIEKGIKEEYINTDYMNIYAIYDYDEDQEQIEAYYAGSSLALKVTDMDSAGMIIDTAFAAGANTLNGISFSASDTDAAEMESLKDAVKDAQNKAAVLAEAAGLKITGIEAVSESGAYSYDNNVGNFSAKRMQDAEETTGSATVVQAAKLIITASVTIIFTAE